ncbi:MAG: hypothetical protein AABY54_05505 [Deltaproteobacteria bacterium]
MPDNSHIIIISLIFLFLALINIPFGMVRSTVPRFSRKWGRCIYIPILLSILMRKLAMVGYTFIPVFLVATVTGQVLGSRIKSNQCIKTEQE